MTKRRLNPRGYAIRPSDAEYEEFDEIWRLNAIAKNPHMHKIGYSHTDDFDQSEVDNALHSRMDCMLDGVQEIWFDAIDGKHSDEIIDESTGFALNKGDL